MEDDDDDDNDNNTRYSKMADDLCAYKLALVASFKII